MESDDSDFIERQGPAFLPHLLRRLSDALVDSGEVWYREQGLSIHPRTSSTLLALDEKGALGVSELAQLLRQSHPLVIQWIRQLGELELVTVEGDPDDRRRSLVSLTRKGKAEVRRLRTALRTLAKSTQALMDEAIPGLFDALWRLEKTNRRVPLLERLRSAGSGRAPK
jgi:DNA-binding MarR family transcriptional regulator